MEVWRRGLNPSPPLLRSRMAYCHDDCQASQAARYARCGGEVGYCTEYPERVIRHVGGVLVDTSSTVHETGGLWVPGREILNDNATQERTLLGVGSSAMCGAVFGRGYNREIRIRPRIFTPPVPMVGTTARGRTPKHLRVSRRRAPLDNPDTAIPVEPASPVFTGSAALAFRKP
jgi:hypothetical protein